LFATPSFDKSVSVDYHTSMISTIVEMHRHGIECDHRLEVGLQFIDLARNKLVDYFLKSDWNFTDLVFIDADQGWDAKVMPRLVSYPQGVVGALPPKKSSAVEPEYHMNAITGVIDPATHLFQSLELGTGCMRIKREIFERMDAAFPQLAVYALLSDRHGKIRLEWGGYVLLPAARGHGRICLDRFGCDIHTPRQQGLEG
jgi:hypothetical protein